MRPALSVGDTATDPPFASMAEAIAGGVARFPDGGFLYFGSQGQQVAVSYRDTLALAHRLVSGCRNRGMQTGDALLICMADATRIVPALWAAAIGGYVAVPMTHAARAGKPIDGEVLATLQRAVSALHIIGDDFVPTGRPDVPFMRFADVAAAANPGNAEVASRPHDMSFAIPTSGTTGRPRLVGLSHRASLARWWPQLPDAAHAEGFLSWAAFDHVMGIGHAMPNLPRKIHLDAGRFVANPASWLHALEMSGATHATMTNFGMSLVLRAVAEAPERRWRLDKVRKIGIGAEAISSRTCQRFLTSLARFGLRDDALILGYGLSECGPVVGGRTPFAGDALQRSDEPPELDRPTAGHAVRIVDDSGLLLEGEVGRIEVRGPTMTDGYVGDPEASAALFTPDRWLRTGDLGLLRDGRLTVVGREKETLIVNARKYSCHEVETVLRNETGHDEVYVAPLGGASETDEAALGAPCAVFVVVEQADATSSVAVADVVREAMARSFRFVPRSVALISPDEIPRTSLGKVRRLALAALLADPDIARRASHLAARTADQPTAGGRTDVASRIARIWGDLLRVDGEIDRDTDFFAIGGDSLLAIRMSFLLEEEFGIEVQFERFPGRLSIAELATYLSGNRTQPVAPPPEPGLPDWLAERLRQLTEKWPGEPALTDGFVRRVGNPHHGVPVFWCMQTSEEARHFETAMTSRFPAYVMRSGVLLLEYDTPLADALIDRYVDEIAQIAEGGPVIIGGNCQGVTIGVAISRRLAARNCDVRLLAAADCRFADICGIAPVPAPVALFPALNSKFNPYRYFRHPEAGLRKLAPSGLRIEMIDARYSQVMFGAAMEHIAHALQAAADWAVSQRQPEPVAHPSPPELYDCRLSTVFKSLELQPGETLRVPVKVKNTSPVAWPPFARSGLMLANHWLAGTGEMSIWSDGRTALEREIQPGGRAYMTLDITAPPRAGDYLLEVDLVEEGVRWFGTGAGSPLHVPVKVRDVAGHGMARLTAGRSSVLAAVVRLVDAVPALTRGAKRRRK
jgi:acyl-CoA synthetase (AMP-forming)/AMP-acid ligase II/acyl carrier protein